MKISSKSLLNPGQARVRTPVNSLSTSLSRRLRTSGSIKGGASPGLFPATAKKRGTFDNPEPSSPKVTCIGQVRVRSKKKQAKKLKSLSKRQVSFRNLDHGFPSKRHKHKESLNLGSNGTHNQHQIQNLESLQTHRKWTICDSLKAFGSEFSCLFQCRTERGDVGGERDVELVVGDVENEEEESVQKSRRHVFEDLEIVNDIIEGHEDEERVGVCVPPKNALLLMRCRTDPMKIEAFSKGSWEPSVVKTDEEEDDEIVEIEQDLEKFGENLVVEQKQVFVLDQDHGDVQFEAIQDQENVQQDEVNQDQENVQQDEANQYQENVQDEANQDQEHNVMHHNEANQDQEDDIVKQNEANQDQEHDIVQQDEANQDQEHDNAQDEANKHQEHNIVEQDELGQYQEHENVQQFEVGQVQEHDNVQQNEADQEQEHDNLQQYEMDQDQEHNQTEESFYLDSLFEEIVNQDYKIQEQDEANEKDNDVIKLAEIFKIHEEEMVNEAEEHKHVVLETKTEKLLPECLLMMMYEPKLSMEVSKETWVCNADFIQCRKKPPPAPVKPDSGGDVLTVEDGGLAKVLWQPEQSSCSLPAPVVLEQKSVNKLGYEPFVLTRCKSEPMKTTAPRLQPESCVLENRKLERLSRVALSVGAAGLGF